MHRCTRLQCNVLSRAQDRGAYETSDKKVQMNRFVHTPIFRMHNPQSIPQMVQKGSWLASVDRRDAYFHVPIHLDFRRYMRLLSGSGLSVQGALLWVVTVSKVFTKRLALIMVQLHQKSIHQYPFLDDVLIRQSLRSR